MDELQTPLIDILDRYDGFTANIEKPLVQSAILVSLLCDFADSDLIDRAAEINRLLGQAFEQAHELHALLCEPVRED
jgi:hypothetical protein